MDLVSNVLDPAIAGRSLQNSCIDQKGRDQAEDTQADRQNGCGKHENFLLPGVECLLALLPDTPPDIRAKPLGL